MPLRCLHINPCRALSDLLLYQVFHCEHCEISSVLDILQPHPLIFPQVRFLYITLVKEITEKTIWIVWQVMRRFNLCVRAGRSEGLFFFLLYQVFYGDCGDGNQQH